ncbi:MAG: amino acid permease [Deltaproteobacteria bacterium]|nr:amino acid permease [Deltaproteobacteria bacterium]
MSAFSSFALSFSIISILTGGVVLYGHGLRYGGPFVMTVGWPLVTVMTLTVAASLAELASAYPTAGALYHWSALFGGPGWGFLTAWLNTIGQFAITAGIDYGLSEFLAPALGWPADRAHVLPLCAAILLSHAVLNHVGVRAVARLNTISAWYHVAGVLLIVAAVLLLAPKQPAGFLLERTTIAPQGYWYGFALGLLQAQWTFTGYDASAHVTEETVDPRRNAPRGIMTAVLASGVAGWVMLLSITLAVRDPKAAVAADNPFIFVLRDALGRVGGALIWVCIVAMWFCGLASVTSSSRMLFAFARDGGTPAAPLLARVSKRWQSPHVAVWVSAAGALLVAAWSEALSAMTALSTIALYASYAAPILLGWLARREGRFRRLGPWNLGRLSSVVNALALAWVALVMILFVLPPNQLAGYTFAGCLVVLAVYWHAFMKQRFHGPPLELE